MARGDFQLSLSKVSSQYILLDPRGFEQVVCEERDGMENPSARGVLGWLELEKLSLGPKPGVPGLASAHVRRGGKEEGRGSKALGNGEQSRRFGLKGSRGHTQVDAGNQKGMGSCQTVLMCSLGEGFPE